MTKTADAIIVGAGVIGAATAFEMAKKGYKVLVVDKNPSAGYGPTSGSCAIIRVHYSTLEGTAFAWEGYNYWRDWAQYLEADDERGLAEFRQTGCMVMRTDRNKFLAAHMGHCDTLDIPYEIWDAQQIKQRLPIYDLRSYWPPRTLGDDQFGQPGAGAVQSAIFWPTAGYVTDPQLSTHNLQRAAEARGAGFLFNRQVVEVIKQGGKTTGIVLNDGEEVHAPVVINVAGPASAKLNTMAGALEDMTISTRPLRQEVVHVPSPAGFDFEHDGMVVSDSDIACYSRPEHGNHILVGSEDPECDEREWVDDEEYNRDFTDQWSTQARRYGQRVPDLGIPGKARGVVDLYDVSDDWIPIYDQSCVPGYYMAIGTSGNQFKNAPIAGMMMAALVEHCEAGNDHDATPLQFHLPYIDRDIDVGFYSRKREINRESSFSVLG